VAWRSRPRSSLACNVCLRKLASNQYENDNIHPGGKRGRKEGTRVIDKLTRVTDRRL